MIRDANWKLKHRKRLEPLRSKQGIVREKEGHTTTLSRNSRLGWSRIGSLQCLSLRCLASEEVRTRMLFEGIRADAP